jgi:ABC-type multidrug transport system fused ATPase/permease subunit
MAASSPVSPEDQHVSYWSEWTYQFVNPFLLLGSNKIIEHEDVWQLPQKDEVQKHFPLFHTVLSEQFKKYTSSNYTILRVAHHVFGFGWEGFYVPAIYYVLEELSRFLTAFILYLLIEFVSDTEAKWYWGYLYALALFLTSLAKTLFIQRYYYTLTRTWARLMSCTSLSVLHKMLRLTPKSRSEFTAGEITNLFSTDSVRLAEFVSSVHEAWIAPTVAVISSIVLIVYFGWCAMIGIAGMVLCVPFLIYLTKKLANVEELMSEIKDERVKLMNEILQGIRVVKFFAWEDKIKEQILEVRNKEFKELKKSAMLKSGESFLTQVVTIIGAGLTFSSYALLGGKLTAPSVFSALTIFNIMSDALWVMPWIITTVVNGLVSTKRLTKFFYYADVSHLPHSIELESEQLHAQTEEQLEEMEITKNALDGTNTAIKFVDASFSWNGSKDQLIDLDLTIQKGQLVCIIGRVGSSKTTLLSALFGDAEKTKGSVFVNGTLSYSSEKPFIINATIRDNIVFGGVFDEERYNQVLSVCQLERDIEQFANGDLTEIGENGINLSGGQQSRISLARACYSESDIVLLDSVLNAVDSHVQKRIFFDCIVRYLKGRTRLLITHSLHLLEYADLVVVMHEGKIEKMGTLQQLKETGFDVAFEIDDHQMEEPTLSEEVEKIIIPSTPEKQEMDEDKGKIIVAEERRKGTITFNVVVQYFKGYGIALCITAFLMALVSKAFQQFSSVWITFWTSNTFTDLPLEGYLGIYLTIGVAAAILILVESCLWSIGNTKTANELHTRLISRILRAPILFFDQNPIGRIINLASQGLYYNLFVYELLIV